MSTPPVVAPSLISTSTTPSATPITETSHANTAIISNANTKGPGGKEGVRGQGQQEGEHGEEEDEYRCCVCLSSPAREAVSLACGHLCCLRCAQSSHRVASSLHFLLMNQYVPIPMPPCSSSAASAGPITSAASSSDGGAASGSGTGSASASESVTGREEVEDVPPMPAPLPPLPYTPRAGTAPFDCVPTTLASLLNVYCTPEDDPARGSGARSDGSSIQAVIGVNNDGPPMVCPICRRTTVPPFRAAEEARARIEELQRLANTPKVCIFCPKEASVMCDSCSTLCAEHDGFVHGAGPFRAHTRRRLSVVSGGSSADSRSGRNDGDSGSCSPERTAPVSCSGNELHASHSSQDLARSAPPSLTLYPPPGSASIPQGCTYRPKCTEHNKETDLFCTTDKVLVCAHCLIGSHKGHDCRAIHPAADSAKQVLSSHCTAIVNKSGNIGQMSASLNKTLAETKQERENLVAQVKYFFSQVHHIVDAVENDRVSTINNAIKPREQKLSKQIESCDTLKRELDRVTDTFSALLSTHSDSMCLSLWGYLEHLSKSLEPLLCATEPYIEETVISMPSTETVANQLASLCSVETSLALQKKREETRRKEAEERRQREAEERKRREEEQRRNKEEEERRRKEDEERIKREEEDRKKRNEEDRRRRDEEVKGITANIHKLATSQSGITVAFTDPHDGGAAWDPNRRILFALYGNDNDGRDLHVTKVDRNGSGAAVKHPNKIPFSTHGAYPVFDGDCRLYVFESESGVRNRFGYIHVETLVFTELSTLHCEKFAEYCSPVFTAGFVFAIGETGHTVWRYSPQANLWTKTPLAFGEKVRLLVDSRTPHVLWALIEYGTLLSSDLPLTDVVPVKTEHSRRPRAYDLTSNHEAFVVPLGNSSFLLFTSKDDAWQVYNTGTKIWVSVEGMERPNGSSAHGWYDAETKTVFIQHNGSAVWARASLTSVLGNSV
ncbi:tripartite motif-containing protein 66 [Pelomyxa schiedti]|nr:tripartite motif-containing protein 66 [Pelomyxa schiedti]